LVQAAEINPTDAVLTIGSGIGYNAAILSHLCSTVVALEENQEMTAEAQKIWDAQSCTNIAAIAGNLADGAPKYAPYDVIIFNGAIARLPDNICAQLKVDGRLLAIIRDDQKMGLAQATLFEKTSEDSLSSRILFESGTPYLKGFSPEKEFVF